MLRNLILHLRFPFSYFLLPVFLFGLSQVNSVEWLSAVAMLLVLHLLVYPASNGYNSYIDQDTGSIGSLEKPPPVPGLIFPVTVFMDVLAIILTYFIHPEVAFLVLAYILASRAYSSRMTRIKRRPVAGFLTVAIFQGSVVFLIAYLAAGQVSLMQALVQQHVIAGMVTSFFLIGAGYPLTQIFQHHQDSEDNVTSLSMKLGYKGTFAFSAAMFTTAIAGFYFMQTLSGNLTIFLLFLLFMLPPGLKLMQWFSRISKDTAYANYKNSKNMNIIGATSLNAFFLLITGYQNL